jgi:DNA polymerase-3 subunit epsilon
LQPSPLRDSNLESLRGRAERYLSDASHPVGYSELSRALFTQSRLEEGVGRVLLRALLGRDRRFRELPRGHWQLRPEDEARTPLREASFAIVDIESTGSDPSCDEIIEIGIVCIENMEIRERYHSLVRPYGAIPSWIRRLTGIDQETVADAPTFESIAPRVNELIQADVFVAHNVDFDYPFLLSQLQIHELNPETRPQLCTVRMARRYLPELESYRLAAVTEHLGIDLERHHRADEDAGATAEIFLHILAGLLDEKDGDPSLCAEDLMHCGVHPRVRHRLDRRADA